MVKYLFVCSVAVLCAIGRADAQLTTVPIQWAAQLDNGFSASSGIELEAGSLIRLGYFNLSDSAILANQSNVAFLNSNFVEAGTARIGAGFDGAASNFSALSNVNTSPTGLNLEGKQIYLWAFRSADNTSVASSVNTAFEIGVFYLANSAGWLFPDADVNPGGITIDLSDLTNAAGTALVTGGMGEVQAKLVIGTFPTGASTTTGGPNFGLAVVPEPASASLALIGGVTLLMRRRRR